MYSNSRPSLHEEYQHWLCEQHAKGIIPSTTFEEWIEIKNKKERRQR